MKSHGHKKIGWDIKKDKQNIIRTWEKLTENFDKTITHSIVESSKYS